MKKYIRRTCFSIMFIVGILLIIQLNRPYAIYQAFRFYGVLDSIEEMSIPDSYLYSYNESNIKKHHALIECVSASYDKSNNKVDLKFNIHDANDIGILGLIVENISSYMKNHSDSYLNDCKIEIILINMGAECVNICNYDRNSDENVNKPSYVFTYCRITYPIEILLSSLKNYKWIEIFDFADNVIVDDMTALDDMNNLRKISCTEGMFTDVQMEKLLMKYPDLIFSFY